MRPKIVVIGSANRDLIVRADRIPTPGETVSGGAFLTAPGGKGANQAVAAARLGAEVWFVGRVGKDSYGDLLLNEMVSDGIHVDFASRDDHAPTGVALIAVDSHGQNAIIVAPGANHRVGLADVESARSAIDAADAVIVQLEIPIETVNAAINAARSAGVRVILNPAPMPEGHPLPDSLLAKVDVLVPNEHEAAQLLGNGPAQDLDWEAAAVNLHEKSGHVVVITLGEAGCVLADGSGVRAEAAIPVEAIDTTAAGDCFTGAFAVAIAEGRSADESAHFASAAAAISVTRLGAQPSLPARTEVDKLVAKYRSLPIKG
jgi:ribokinase